MGGPVQHTRRWPRPAALVVLAGLTFSCPSGDKAQDDTGGTKVCDTPGYGTLGLSFVMADEYSESVKDQLDGHMALSINYVPDPIDTCDDYRRHRFDHVAGTTTGLDLVMDFQVPVGQICGDVDGEIEADGQPGYPIYCDGEMDLAIVQECTRTEAVIVVTCELNAAVDTSDGA